MTRLEPEIQTRGLTVFARIDHAAGPDGARPWPAGRTRTGFAHGDRYGARANSIVGRLSESVAFHDGVQAICGTDATGMAPAHVPGRLAARRVRRQWKRE